MSEAASEKPQTEQAQTSSTKEPATVAREGHVHTGDVLRQVEELSRRQTTVERHVGIIAKDGEDDDEEEEQPGTKSDKHDRGGAKPQGKARRSFWDVDVDAELGLK